MRKKLIQQVPLEHRRVFCNSDSDEGEGGCGGDGDEQF